MPNMHTLSQRVLVKPTLIGAITAASNNGTGVNCLGYARAAAIFHSAPSGTGTTSDCKLQESADNSTFADVTSATFTQVTTAGGAKLALMDIDLSKRLQYLRLVHTGAGGSAAGQFEGSILLFNGQGMPPTQDVTPVSV